LVLSKVVVESFKEGIFYSSIYITDGVTTKKIDSRTSDAIALALSMNAPIYATKSVINETGIEANSFINSDADTTANNPTIEELEAQLRIYEQNEEYEKAAELMKRINKILEAKDKGNQQ
jgi:bifunctional DNase/RNase